MQFPNKKIFTDYSFSLSAQQINICYNLQYFFFIHFNQNSQSNLNTISENVTCQSNLKTDHKIIQNPRINLNWDIFLSEHSEIWTVHFYVFMLNLELIPSYLLLSLQSFTVFFYSFSIWLYYSNYVCFGFPSKFHSIHQHHAHR